MCLILLKFWFQNNVNFLFSNISRVLFYCSFWTMDWYHWFCRGTKFSIHNLKLVCYASNTIGWKNCKQLINDQWHYINYIMWYWVVVNYIGCLKIFNGNSIMAAMWLVFDLSIKTYMAPGDDTFKSLLWVYATNIFTKRKHKEK